MTVQAQNNPEIEQAIERLHEKMRTVSAALEMTRHSPQKKPANQNKAKKGAEKSAAKNTAILSKLLKTLLILVVLATISFSLAFLVSKYIEQVKSGSALPAEQSQTTAENNGKETDDIVQEPVKSSQDKVEKTAATQIIATTATADFTLKSARYRPVQTEFGPAIDIFITVINSGDAAGQPQLFEIELVNENNKQLMGWPMAVAGEQVQPDKEIVYKTRLLEPPPGFKNIRVSMRK